MFTYLAKYVNILKIRTKPITPLKPQPASIQHLPVICRKLYHTIVILSTQIHKVVIHRIDYLTFHVHFIMQVRSGTLAGTPYPANHFSAHYLPAQLRSEITQVGIPRLIAKSMIDDDNVTVTGLPSHFDDSTITRGINIRTRISREVHAGMKLLCSINRVYTGAVTGSGLLKVFV